MPNPLVGIPRHGLIWRALIACGIVATLVLVWHFTPLSQIANPRTLVKQIESISQDRWAPFMFIGAYLLGGVVMFPVTVLGAAVAIIFPPLEAVAISFTGITLSAALHHWIGSHFLRKRANASLGRIRKRLDELLTDQSIVTIAALRMVPIAPFVLVNVVAGCMGVRFRDYMLGTALGLAPSITVMCLFGQRVRAFWHHPSVTGVLLIGGVALAWLGLAFGLQRWVAGRKGKAPPAQVAPRATA
ncbi:MAG: VTT domain-containing protein [Gammaproteobacteria bacterium]